MADNTLDYVANIRANTKQVDAAVREIGQKVKAISTINLSNFGAAQKPMGKLVGLATEFEKSMEAANARVLAFGASVGVIVGVKNAFVGLVAEAVKFNDEMIKINSVLGASSRTVEKFGDNLFNIAQRTSQSIRVVNEAALEFSRQGLGMEETLKRTEAAMKLTRIAGIGAADATRKLTAAINTFKSQGEDVTSILDKIVKVEQGFAVDTNDLASAIERAGSTAVAAGVKFNDFLGIVTAVQERTARGGAVIGNAVKTIFSRLQNETRLANIEGILNVSLFDNQDRPLQMVERIKKIANELKKVTDPLKREAVLQELAGTYQKNIGEALLSDIQSNDSVLARAAKEAYDSAGAAARKNIQLNTSLLAQFQSLVEQTRELGVNLAKLGTTDWIQDLLSFAKSLVASIDGLLERTDLLGLAFRSLVQGISSLMGPAGFVGLAVVGKFFLDFVKFAKESVQSLLHVNNVSNKQKIIENEILDILRRDETVRSIILNQTISQVEVEERLNAIIASRIKQRERETQLVSNTSLSMARSGNFNVSRSGNNLTTKMTEADINKARIVQAATGLSVAAAMKKEDQEKMLGGARMSDSSKTIPIRTSGANVKTGVINSSEKVIDLPGFGTVVIPKNMIESSVAKGGISANDMNMVLPPNVAEKAGLTSKNVSPIRSRAIRDLVDGYITSGFLGFKSKKTENLDFPAAMIKAIQGDKLKSSIFYDLFGHWRGMFAGERKSGGGSAARDNLSYLNKLAVEDSGIKGELFQMISSGLLNYLTSGGKSMPPLTLGKSFGKAYTLVLPTTSDTAAMNPNAPTVALDANLSRVGNQGTKGTGMMKAIWDAAITNAVKMVPANRRASIAPLIARYKPKIWFPSSLDFALTPEAALEKAEKDPRFAEKLKSIDVPFARFTGEKNSKDGWKYEKMSVQKQGFFGPDDIQNYAMGRIPGLGEAIGREMSSGVPAGSIYVDSNPSLKNPNNPMGLMVANRIHEPFGGQQGIARARKEGINPKNYGIPNFAPMFNSEERGAKGAAGPKLGEYAGLLNKELARLTKEIRSGAMNFAQASKEADKLKDAFKLSQKQLDRMNSKLSWAEKNRYPEVIRGAFGMDGPARIGLTPTTQEDPAVIEAAKRRAAELQRKIEVAAMMSPEYKKVNQEKLAAFRQDDLLRKWNNTLNSLDSGAKLQTDINRIERERLALLKLDLMERRKTPIKSGISQSSWNKFGGLYAAENTIGFAGSQAIAPTNTAKRTGLFSNIRNRYKNMSEGARFTAGLGLTFGLPTLGAAIDESFVSKDKERINMSSGQRFASSALTEGLGFVATGAMIGGPAGAAIGAIIGLGNAARKSSLSLEELDKAFQERANVFEERQAGAKSAQGLIETLTNANERDSNRLQAQSELNRLQARDYRIREILGSGDIMNAEDRKSIISQLQAHERYIAGNKDFLSFFPTGGTEDDIKVRDQSVDRIVKSFMRDTGDKVDAQNNISSMFGVLDDTVLKRTEELLTRFDSYNRSGFDVALSSLSASRSSFGDNSTETTLNKAIFDIVARLPERDQGYMIKTIRNTLSQVLSSRQQFTPQDKELESLRTGQDLLRAQSLKIGRSSRLSQFNNSIIDRMESLQMEINEVLLSNLEDYEGLIRERGATALSKQARDFAAEMQNSLQDQLGFITQVDPNTFGLSAKELKTQFIDPASRMARGGDATGLSRLIQQLGAKIPEYAIEEDKLRIKQSIDAIVEMANNIIKNNQVQILEIQTRTLLNSSLQESEMKLKKFVQGINEAQAQFNFNRIGQNASMEIALNRAEYAASKFIGTPWETDRNSIRTQENSIRRRTEFAVEGIRQNAAFETKKLLAQTNNTLAIQNLTKVLMDFLGEQREQILGANINDPARRDEIINTVKNMTDDELRATIQNKGVKEGIRGAIDSFKAGNGSGFFGNIFDALKAGGKNSAVQRQLAQLELTRRSGAGMGSYSSSSVLNKLLGPDGDYLSVVSAAERIMRSGGQLTQQGLSDEIGGATGEIIRNAKSDDWAAIWEGLTNAASATEQAMSDMEIQIAGLNDRFKDANMQTYYARAREQQETQLRMNILDLQNMPGTTPEQLVEATQALKRFQENDPFGKFVDGLELAFARIETETLSFQNQLGQNIPNLFRDNMAQAISDITMRTSSVKDALMNAAASFFGELNKAFSRQVSSQFTQAIGGLFGVSGEPQAFARGGKVMGGSGIRDDVPAVLTGGEYVVKRSAAQKYGTSFLDALNAGRVMGFASGGSVGGNMGGAIITGALSSYFASKASSDKGSMDEFAAMQTLAKYGKQRGPDFFIPGITTPNGKYQGAIAGKKNLLKFVRQGFTSGSQDKIITNGESLSMRLEDESVRLGIVGRLGSDIAGEVRGTKEQALGVYQNYIIDQLRVREEEKAQKEAQKNQLISSLVGAVVLGGISSMSTGAQNSITGLQTQNAAAGKSTTFWDKLGAGLKGTIYGYDGKGGIGNLLSGNGFTTYAPKALPVGYESPISQTGAAARSAATSLPTYNSLGLPDTFSGDLGSTLTDIDFGRQAFYNPNIPSIPLKDLLLDEYSYNRNLEPDYDFLNGFYKNSWYSEEIDPTMVLPRKQGYMGGGKIPVALNGGEHIINNKTANQIGKKSMGMLNRGVMPMLDGGETMPLSSGSPSANSEKLLKAVEKLDESTRKPEIHITINYDKNGSTTTESSSVNAREQDRKLTEKIAFMIQQALIDETRQGGILRR